MPRKLTGSKVDCEYYPCHFEGQDCTWCFCPIYPCLDASRGGKMIKSKRTGKKVWSCKNCNWIHQPRVAKRFLDS